MATMQKLRSYRGPALFSHGFRLFFLSGAIYAGAMVPLWLTVFAGHAALSALDLVGSGAGVHAWTGGAIGSMTIAVMTRASLGHTGQALSASVLTQGVYAAIVIAAVARVCAALDPSHSAPLLSVSGVAWAAAFFGFALAYSPLLCRARKF